LSRLFYYKLWESNSQSLNIQVMRYTIPMYIHHHYIRNALIALGVVGIVGIGFAFGMPRQKTLGQGTLIFGQTTLSVTVADTDALRKRGLSGASALGERSGMLFVFPSADRYGFWMKDTNFDLDMVWLDDQYCVVDVTENVSKDSYPNVFYPKVAVNHVLEIAAGNFKRLGLTVGECATYTSAVDK
jgi:uncharacterized membrane protein (UPF0127 family)